MDYSLSIGPRAVSVQPVEQRQSRHLAAVPLIVHSFPNPFFCVFENLKKSENFRHILEGTISEKKAFGHSLLMGQCKARNFSCALKYVDTVPNTAVL